MAKSWMVRFVLLPLVWMIASACSSSGQYVWVHDLPPSAPQPTRYVITSGDLLDIRVYPDNPSLPISARARVREDGKIMLNMLGDVDTRGRTPSALAGELKEQLKRLIQQPRVTVNVEEVQPTKVTVLGEVASPGVFTLPPAAGVLEALASAGGLSEFANRDAIYVIRTEPTLRVRFKYSALVENDPRAVGFLLRSADVVTVE